MDDKLGCRRAVDVGKIVAGNVESSDFQHIRKSEREFRYPVRFRKLEIIDSDDAPNAERRSKPYQILQDIVSEKAGAPRHQNHGILEPVVGDNCRVDSLEMREHDRIQHGRGGC